jgi:hypothetical protein
MLQRKVFLAAIGPAGAGKSSLIEAVRDAFGHSAHREDCVKRSFAAPLKDAVNAAEVALGLTPTGWDDYAAKAALRPLLVEMGKAVRARNPDHFAMLMAESAAAKRCPQIVLVDDMRYLNEYQYLTAKGALVVPIRVVRDGYKPANDEEASSLSVLDAAFPDMPSHLTVPEWRSGDELRVSALTVAKLLVRYAAVRRDL